MLAEVLLSATETFTILIEPVLLRTLYLVSYLHYFRRRDGHMS